MPNLGKSGLLLVNLGTPTAPTPSAVRTYLRQFLSDPRVLDINPIGRALLLNLIILPFRPSKSAAAYQKIWTQEGSPLLVESQQLQKKVAARLEGEYIVELGMRYGEPSIPSALSKLVAQGASRIIVLPLYPHYSSASTGSSIEEVFRWSSEQWNVPSILVGEEFYDHPAFVQAFAISSKSTLQESRAEHVLFSFHGLPERHMRKSDYSKRHCLEVANCCETLVEANRHCYKAQCTATAHAIAKQLGLPREQYTICYQSRLGRDPWIKPYTDEIVTELAKKGIKRLAVFCPAFVADCLETLEEIGMRAKEDFVEAGGESLTLIPSLNSHDAWVDAVVQLTRETAQVPNQKAFPI